MNTNKNARYIVTERTAPGGCRFKASVIDTSQLDDSEDALVCECYLVEQANNICYLLNKVNNRYVNILEANGII
jgi:hypothetical protein